MNIKNYEVRTRLGNRIRDLRKENGLTQEQLACSAHITRANLSRIENGDYGTSIDILSNIAQAMGKKLDIV